MTIRYVADSGDLAAVEAALGGVDRIALDCEAAGYHRYSDRICLIQITAGAETFLVDPLSTDPGPVLRPVLEDSSIEVVMHGADFDIRLLDRDLDIRLEGLFDTQIAASLLGITTLGLQGLLEERLGVSVSKQYQRADWAQRPLPEPMKEYAAYDTMHLHRLADELARELTDRDRIEWAREEFLVLEKVRFEDRTEEDPVRRIRAARDLAPRELARLREALRWRDGIARERDRALFRVVGDGPLVEVARRNPRDLRALSDVQGLSGALAAAHGEGLLSRFHEMEGRAETDLEAYPRNETNGAGSGGRPPPEVESRMARLKQVRNARASSLGIDRGTLLSNAILLVLAEAPPANPEELEQVEGLRRWQAELLGEELLQTLEDTMGSGD